MTHPSDIAGLSERLRERVRRLGSTPTPASVLHFMDCIVPLLDAAATALDSLSELSSRSVARLAEVTEPGSIGAFAARDHWKERALRAEQQRDEAYERAAKWHDDKVEQLSRWASEKPSDSRAIAAGAGINMHRASAAAIRRLASGPEGGSEGEK